VAAVVARRGPVESGPEALSLPGRCLLEGLPLDVSDVRFDREKIGVGAVGLKPEPSEQEPRHFSVEPRGPGKLLRWHSIGSGQTR